MMSTVLHDEESYLAGLGEDLKQAFLVAQTVKNPSAIQNTEIPSLGWEDPLEKGMATSSSILCLENSMDRGAWQATVHGVVKSDTAEWLTLSLPLQVKI